MSTLRSNVTQNSLQCSKGRPYFADDRVRSHEKSQSIKTPPKDSSKWKLSRISFRLNGSLPLQPSSSHSRQSFRPNRTLTTDLFAPLLAKPHTPWGGDEICGCYQMGRILARKIASHMLNMLLMSPLLQPLRDIADPVCSARNRTPNCPMPPSLTCLG